MASRPTVVPPVSKEEYIVKVKLTPREIEALRHVAEGLSDKEIATLMHTTLRTVKYHLGQLRVKLSLEGKGRAGLVIWAFRAGIIT